MGAAAASTGVGRSATRRRGDRTGRRCVKVKGANGVWRMNVALETDDEEEGVAAE